MRQRFAGDFRPKQKQRVHTPITSAESAPAPLKTPLKAKFTMVEGNVSHSIDYKIIEARFKMKMRISDIAEALKLDSQTIMYVLEIEGAEIQRQKSLKGLIILEPENYPHRSGKYKGQKLKEIEVVKEQTK